MNITEAQHFSDDGGECGKVLKFDMGAEVGLVEVTDKEVEILCGGKLNPPLFS